MRQRGITNVIVMGVHINMCVLGRPFGLRQMAKNGKNVVLVRDLTDDLLEHILDGDDAGHVTVLVHHDRHVVARVAEILQQDIEALAFRDDRSGTDCRR